MKTTPAVHVQTETRGDVPRFAVRLAAAKVQSLLRMAPEPVLFARLTLTRPTDSWTTWSSAGSAASAGYPGGPA